MNALLSIKPEYVDAIVKGTKRYEFRRTIFKKRVETAYIYCNSTVKRIVGCFTVGRVLRGTPKQIWRLCHQEGGISEQNFFKYFENSTRAFAITIEDFCEFETPLDPHNVWPTFRAPQSFYYIPAWYIMKPVQKGEEK